MRTKSTKTAKEIAAKAKHRAAKANHRAVKAVPFEQQPCNVAAPLEDVKRWVGKVCRRIETPEAAKRRLRRASKDVERCRLTQGCDAQHHVQLAFALRQQWAVFL